MRVHIIQEEDSKDEGEEDEASSPLDMARMCLNDWINCYKDVSALKKSGFTER